MDEKTYNHEFKLSSYFGKESLKEEEILNILKSDYGICREFHRSGIITSKKYSFITKVTFSEYEKNCMESTKDENEILQAKRNVKIVEDYFNKCLSSNEAKVHVNFAERKDNECALYNMNRFNYNTIQDKLEEIFAR